MEFFSVPSLVITVNEISFDTEGMEVVVASPFCWVVVEEEEEEEVVEVEVEVEDVEVVEESSVIFCRLLDVSSSSAPLFMIEFVQILWWTFRVSYSRCQHNLKSAEKITSD